MERAPVWRRYGFGAAVWLVGLALLLARYHLAGTLLGGWDAQFYYAAARSLVFDHDLEVTNDLTLSPWAQEGLPRRADGRIVNKYPLGLSLIEAPFLALGRLLRAGLGLLGWELPQPPGYSFVEVGSVAVGILTLFALGLETLRALLRRLCPPPWALLSLVAAWWGTSLLYYSAVFPFMAHAVGFALVVWAVALAQKIGEGDRPRQANLLLLGALVGLLFLVRPQQGTLAVCLVPLLWPLLRRGWQNWLPGALGGAVAFGACVFVQLAANHEQFGVWALSGYAEGGESFAWLAPRFDVVLTSASRGLLWMSPVVVLAAAGYVCCRPRWDRAFAYAFLLQGLAQVYVVACWSSPEQGDSFGMRMWCECVPCVACGLAMLFGALRPRGRLVLAVVVALAVGWTNALLVLFVTKRLEGDPSHAEVLRRLADLVLRRG